jgi:hypothetical protein
MGKEPHVRPLAFCNANIVLIEKYFLNMIFFNFKTGSIDMLQLRKGFMNAFYFDPLLLSGKEHSWMQH